MAFSTSLNFTSANEDGRTELTALDLSAADNVLCLTASGTRPLDLLLGDPGHITALDVNPAQNHLLALKIGAMRALEREPYLAFVGLQPDDNRIATYQTISSDLPQPSREFWDQRIPTIERGIWHSGRWERVLRLGAWGNRLIRGSSIDRLLEASSTKHQEQVWREEFDDWKWHAAISLLSRRWFWTKVIGEPGGAFLPPREETKSRLVGAFNRAVAQFLMRESDFASLIFTGRQRADGALPVHLSSENYQIVRNRLNRISIVDGDLAQIAERSSELFTAFSLSDFGSYCDQSTYDRCWREIISVAQPGARFCERTFMNPLSPAETIAEGLAIDEPLSKRLTNDDRAIIYEIRAGTIRQSRPMA